MTFKEYWWFIKNSFSYMKGYHKLYILWHFPGALYRYRKMMIKDKIKRNRSNYSNKII